MADTDNDDFSRALLTWFDEHGRKTLPWQKPITPYRVWLSEIMLQQTQVDTVIPYFLTFTERFPHIQDLAKAPIDDVLHLWTGLGYYARARNLHKCATMVVDEHNGEIPDDPEVLQTLPGIGRSTAHAIASIAFGKSTAILDGNVKRVLTRFHGISGWPGKPAVEKLLWEHAEKHMPSERCGDYSQAIMDLGATLCTRSKPSCERCPMIDNCQALIQNRVHELPEKKPRKTTPTKTTVMLILVDQHNQLLLTKRPDSGIWGGLWSFEEFDTVESAKQKAMQLGTIKGSEQLETVKHVFSHYKLMIQPLKVTINSHPRICDNSPSQWHSREQALQCGLAAPVKRLIETLDEQQPLLI